MPKKVLLSVLILFCAVYYGRAQDNDDWESYFIEERVKELDPMIEVNLGILQPSLYQFTPAFTELGMIEAKLGYSEFDKFKNYIWKMDERYLLSSYIHHSLDIANKSINAGDIEIKANRFGLGNRTGFGYALGRLIFVPYNAHDLIFSKLTYTEPVALSQQDLGTLYRYTYGYKFGMSTSDGVMLKLSQSLAAGAAYEWAAVYPVVIFPQWFTSFLMIQSGLSVISFYSEKLIKISPVLGPIVLFSLKSGLGYLFYKNMEENMHWPFKSEAPIFIKTVNIGFSMRF